MIEFPYLLHLLKVLSSIFYTPLYNVGSNSIFWPGKSVSAYAILHVREQEKVTRGQVGTIGLTSQFHRHLFQKRNCCIGCVGRRTVMVEQNSSQSCPWPLFLNFWGSQTSVYHFTVTVLWSSSTTVARWRFVEKNVATIFFPTFLCLLSLVGGCSSG